MKFGPLAVILAAVLLSIGINCSNTFAGDRVTAQSVADKIAELRAMGVVSLKDAQDQQNAILARGALLLDQSGIEGVEGTLMAQVVEDLLANERAFKLLIEINEAKIDSSVVQDSQTALRRSYMFVYGLNNAADDRNPNNVLARLQKANTDKRFILTQNDYNTKFAVTNANVANNTARLDNHDIQLDYHADKDLLNTFNNTTMPEFLSGKIVYVNGSAYVEVEETLTFGAATLKKAQFLLQSQKEMIKTKDINGKLYEGNYFANVQVNVRGTLSNGAKYMVVIGQKIAGYNVCRLIFLEKLKGDRELNAKFAGRIATTGDRIEIAETDIVDIKAVNARQDGDIKGIKEVNARQDQQIISNKEDLILTTKTANQALKDAAAAQNAAVQAASIANSANARIDGISLSPADSGSFFNGAVSLNVPGNSPRVVKTGGN